MKGRGRLFLGASGWLLVCLAANFLQIHAAQAAELTVCLDEESPPLSEKRRSGDIGFDVLVAQEVASRLNRDLRIQWFEGEHERDSSAAVDTSALLSAGKCDLVASYPLLSVGLGRPTIGNAFLPRHEGGRGGPRGPLVRLGALVVSAPYYRVGLEIVLASSVADRNIRSLEDLSDLKLGARAGTLGGTLLMAYQHGRYIGQIVSLPVNGDTFTAMEAGSFEASLVERHAFGLHRARNPETQVVSSGFKHPLGFNIGFATLADRSDLLSEVNGVINSMRADGTIEKLAAASEFSYLPPARPYMLDKISPILLYGADG